MVKLQLNNKQPLIMLRRELINNLNWNKGDKIMQHVNKDGQIILTNLTKN